MNLKYRSQLIPTETIKIILSTDPVPLISPSNTNSVICPPDSDEDPPSMDPPDLVEELELLLEDDEDEVLVSMNPR